MTSEVTAADSKPTPKPQPPSKRGDPSEAKLTFPPILVKTKVQTMGVHVKPELTAGTHTAQNITKPKPRTTDLEQPDAPADAGCESLQLDLHPQTLDGTSHKNPYLPWAQSEDEMIRKVIKELHVAAGGNPDDGSVPEMKSISWVKVSNRIPGRSPKQCRERWRNALNPSINHCPWTLQEDIFLLNAQREFGNKWVKIASQLHGRTENGVKTRYKSIMRAKKRAWKKNEDSQLMSMYNHVGANWKEIAGSLPGRSVNGVKLRYRQLLSGTPNEPPSGSPEQALKVFYSCYGGSGSMPFSSDSYRLNMGSHASSFVRSEGVDSLAGNRSANTAALGVSSLDTIHPCKSRKRKGTRATLLDKLEKERAGPRCKFSDLMATLLAKVPEETQTDGTVAHGVSGAREELMCSPVAPRDNDMFLSEIMDFPASLENKPEPAKLTPF